MLRAAKKIDQDILGIMVTAFASTESAVEAMRLADSDAARKLIGEWATGEAKSPLTVAAKRK